MCDFLQYYSLYFEASSSYPLRNWMHHHVQGATKIGDLAKHYQIYSFKYRVHLLHGYYNQTLTFEDCFINEKTFHKF